jgi:ubiquinone/menaquinone biosynthesis C-methylase UbiE
MMFKGDTEKQAILRDQAIKKRKKIRKNRYVSRILSFSRSGMRLLDVGCGTAHIIQELAMHERNSSLIGVDVSAAMLKIARSNVRSFENIALVGADGLKLPFHDGVFDIVISRLAEHSINEAHRVLGDGGFFFEYDLGPDADKEIVEFFPDRVERDNFFIPKSPEGWRKEVCEDIVDANFTILDIKDYVENDYYKDENELMNLIEMVPLVREFDRIKDRRKVHELAEK